LGWILPQRIGISKEPDLEFPSIGRFYYSFYYSYFYKEQNKEAQFITNQTPRYSKTIHPHIIHTSSTHHSWTDHSRCCRELGLVISNFEPVGFAVGKYVPFRTNAWINIQTTYRYIAPVTMSAWHQASTFDAESRTEAVCSGQLKLLNASFTADPLQGLSGIENVGSVCGTS
jgi:hypothetical protein